MAKSYRLKLKRLDFISAVDAGAQGSIADVALIKRRDADGIEATFQVAKVDAPLGLVFGWALATSLDGGTTPHVDLQNDAIEETDLIKVAAEFMSDAAKSDVMHDGDADGQIVFCMPLVPEVNKALGIESQTHGLAIAMKPSAATFKRFQSGELKAFSIAGIGLREPIDKRLEKRAALTTAVDGHTHLLSGIDEYQSGCTSSEYTPGTDHRWHSHPWVREGDTIVIGESHGHTHTIATAIAAAKRSPVVIDASKSTTANATPTVVNNTEPSNMTTDADKIAALEKRNSVIMKMALLCLALPETHRAHAASLSADEVEPFVTKSFTDRELVVKSTLDADPEVYKTAAGISIRKSQGPLMEMIARQNDANAVELAKSKEREQVALYKARARTDIGHLAGDEDSKVALLKAVDTITDDKARDAATAILKGADAAMKALGKPAGVNPGDAPPPANNSADAFDALSKGLTTFAKANNIPDAALWTTGLDAFVATPEGAVLKAAYDAVV